MPRCRVLDPETETIQLADFHKRAHDKLLNVGTQATETSGKLKVDKDNKPVMRPATPDEIAASERRMARAEQDGDWIEVKTKLSYGESRKSYTSVVKFYEGQVIPDLELIEIAQLVSYLVDWSMIDKSGKKIPVDTIEQKLGALKSFDTPDTKELIDAVTEHIERTEAQENERKNGLPAGAMS